MTKRDKVGRPRRYDLRAEEDAADVTVGYALAALEEALARVEDQIADLPPEALTWTPAKSALSIGALVVHMAWAEAGWVARLTGVAVPAELDAQLQPAGRAVPAGEAPPSAAYTAEGLTALCRRVRAEVTRPALSALPDAGARVAPGEGSGAARPLTPQGVLMHLIWHWTYHSGQVGLLRELWGADYTWTFGSLMG
jgi:uncharacterized damage-inducible protein DinB